MNGRWRRLIDKALLNLEVQVNHRWRRLLIKAAREQKISLNYFGETSLKQGLVRMKEQKTKEKKLRIFGKWRYLMEGMLWKEAINMRWVRLINGMMSNGLLRRPQSMKDVVGRVISKNKKMREMELLRRWRVLINGVLTNDIQVSEASLKRWTRLILTIQSRGLLNIGSVGSIVTRLRQ